MTRPTIATTKPDHPVDGEAMRTRSAVSPGYKSRPMSTKRQRALRRVEFSTSDNNGVAFRTFLRDYLVPVLAEDFLARREKARGAKGSANRDGSTFQPLVREGGR